ncbi:hypothetical protein OG762_52190 (plasmid) [Streptomyces sp. NBC_01136]|uniref:hypothetical protein n=1 Tax=Streptomyces sp. NBC_01136 TaxID=2903754 RepID=UPI002F91573A|nr:hypothetical protein OG762_52190 [Streptomyces sp. NBC_01136]
MSDSMAMERAASHTGQTAAIALQVLVMAAQALREHQEREVARAAAAPAPAAEPDTSGASEPAQEPARDPDRDRYAQMVRHTVEPPAVAEAMVTAPQWPQVADELRRLENAGVNVGQFLADATPVIARIDADMRAGSPTPGVTASATATTPRNPFAAPAEDTSAEREGPGMVKQFVEWVKKVVEAVKEWFKKVTGRGEDSGLDGREKDLAKHGVSPQENTRAVVMAREAMADEHVLGQLVTSREWPGIAAQMKTLQEAGHDPREALAGVPLRMKQAADAGISLSPAEAARGLLNEQAKTPVPARATTAPAPANSASAAPQATPATAPSATTSATPAAAPPRAAAANAQSTTATPGASPAPGPQASTTTPTPAPTQARGHTR